jgi:H+-translocating NAD(P) transhydrogenase subunit alpha
MSCAPRLLLPALIVLAGLLPSFAFAQPDKSSGAPSESFDFRAKDQSEAGAESKAGGAQNPASATSPSSGSETAKSENATADAVRKPDLIANLTIFVLAVFVGFEVITKVPPTLHTPLMSGSNAISGITVVGAIVIAGSAAWGVEPVIGFFAVVLATINVVGGFLVTHRMLAMFKRR